MKIDEIEEKEEYKKVEKEVDEKVKFQLKFQGFEDETVLGYCHIYWATKKQILKEEYGIEWKSPEELNPEIIFD